MRINGVNKSLLRSATHLMAVNKRYLLAVRITLNIRSINLVSGSASVPKESFRRMTRILRSLSVRLLNRIVSTVHRLHPVPANTAHPLSAGTYACLDVKDRWLIQKKKHL